MIIQILIVIFGITSSFLVGGKTNKSRFYGFLAALVGQIPWCYMLVNTKQYFLVLLMGFYAFNAIRGVRNNYVN